MRAGNAAAPRRWSRSEAVRPGGKQLENSFRTGLHPGQKISNAEIMAIFRCACEGGIRPSRRTGTIVLVVNHLKPPEEIWRAGVLNFAGFGGKGDQTLAGGRNKTLLAAFEQGKGVYLFEVFRQGEYTYRGRVELAGPPFERQAPDRDGQARRVWLFPLRLAAGAE